MSAESDAASLFALARDMSAAGRSLEARLALAAGLAALAKPLGTVPIVVGGTAVDFHAAASTPKGLEPNAGLQASQDVDVITLGQFGPDAASLRTALESSGEFRAQTPAIPVEGRRQWWLRDTRLLVEVLGGELYGDPERVVTIEVEGHEAVMWGPEDTAWHYAQAALATRDRTSWERARVIAAIHSRGEDWDWDYLRTRPDELAPTELVDALEAGDSYEQMLERVEFPADGQAGRKTKR